MGLQACVSWYQCCAQGLRILTVVLQMCVALFTKAYSGDVPATRMHAQCDFHGIHNLVTPVRADGLSG